MSIASIEWQPIPGFPDYEVSNTGLVRSHKRKKLHILKTGGSPGDYRYVSLRRNGKTHVSLVGRLVLLAFQGPCPEGCEMCHNDGNPTNDHINNLRWDTHLANMRDSGRHWIEDRIKSPPIVRNEAFINALGAIQKELGLTQGQFAKYLGISHKTLSKLYAVGIKDSTVIKILRKHPELVQLF